MKSNWVNGVSGQGIPADDLGFARGLAVFETVRTYGNRVFRLEPHLDRLRLSAETMDIDTSTIATMRDEVLQLAEEAPNRCIRMSLTASLNRVITARPIDETRVGSSVDVACVPMEPTPWLPGHVKHSSRAGWVLAARTKRVDEVLFVDRHGHLLEANRSNVFVVMGGEIHTPPCDGSNLKGVTRGAMIEAARQLGILQRLPRAFS